MKRYRGWLVTAAMAVLLLAASGARAASLYATDQIAQQGGTSVFQFGLGSGGSLMPLTPPTVPMGGVQGWVLAASPDGNSLYVTETGSQSTTLKHGVAQFDVAGNGTLSAKSTPTVDGATTPRSIAVSPNGLHAYVTDMSASTSGVWQYDIGSGGLLGLRSAPTGDTVMGNCPAGIAISPDSQHVYVADPDCFGSNGGIHRFTVGVSGSLSKTGLPVSASGAGWLAMSPDGKSLYAVAANPTGASPGSATGAIYQFDVAPDGSLTPKSTATVTPPPGFETNSMVVSPDGKSAYVTAFSGFCNKNPKVELLQYDVGNGGLLTPKSTSTAPASGDGISDIAISADGSSVYAVFQGSCTNQPGGVLHYSVGPGGQLTAGGSQQTTESPGGIAVISSPASHPAQHKLTVTVGGTGSGRITATGISCPGTCTVTRDAGSMVTLADAPARGSVFAGWGGACSGTGPCTVTLSADQTVTAKFNLLPKPRCSLTVDAGTVLVKASKHSKRKPGTLPLTLRCDQAASFTLSGEFSTLKHKKLGNSVIKGTLRRNSADHVTLTLPEGALAVLRRGKRIEGVFALVALGPGGAGHGSATVALRRGR